MKKNYMDYLSVCLCICLLRVCVVCGVFFFLPTKNKKNVGKGGGKEGEWRRIREREGGRGGIMQICQGVN